MRNWAVEHNVAVFRVSFAVRWQGKLSRGEYYEYSGVGLALK